VVLAAYHGLVPLDVRQSPLHLSLLRDSLAAELGAPWVYQEAAGNLKWRLQAEGEARGKGRWCEGDEGGVHCSRQPACPGTHGSAPLLGVTLPGPLFPPPFSAYTGQRGMTGGRLPAASGGLLGPRGSEPSLGACLSCASTTMPLSASPAPTSTPPWACQPLSWLRSATLRLRGLLCAGTGRAGLGALVRS